MSSLRDLRTSLILWNNWKVSGGISTVGGGPKLQHDTWHGTKLPCLVPWQFGKPWQGVLLRYVIYICSYGKVF